MIYGTFLFGFSYPSFASAAKASSAYSLVRLTISLSVELNIHFQLHDTSQPGLSARVLAVSDVGTVASPIVNLGLSPASHSILGIVTV